MKTYKTRHQFYLPDELSEKLEVMAGKPGTSKTAILTDALVAWFERRGAEEMDKRFGRRLDRQSRATERSERKLDALTELLGVFVQHQLASTAHQPEISPEATLLGSKRYNKLLDFVEQRLDRGGTAARFVMRPTKDGDDT